MLTIYFVCFMIAPFSTDIVAGCLFAFLTFVVSSRAFRGLRETSCRIICIYYSFTRKESSLLDMSLRKAFQGKHADEFLNTRLASILKDLLRPWNLPPVYNTKRHYYASFQKDSWTKYLSVICQRYQTDCHC